MRALLVPCNAMPRPIEINSLSDIQTAVGGYVEACGWIFDNNPAIYLNEEGKLTCEPNRAVYATAADEGNIGWDNEPIHEGYVLDIIFGDFVCIGFDPETGEDRDISDEEIERVMQRFGTPESVQSGFLESLRIVLRAERI